MDIKYSSIIEKFGNKYGSSPAYHYYAILSKLSTYFNDSVIVDLGTLYGNSAAALSYNKTNIVYTYDIEHRAEATDIFKKEEFKNIEYIIGDCIENDWKGFPIWDTHPNTWPTPYHIGDQPKNDKEIFLSSELIFMDVDPHDGIKEDRVLNFLISNNWKGVLVCDDIGTGREPGKQNAHPSMRDWWNTIDLPKYDISKNYYAAGTGTGVVCFDNQEVIF